MSISLYDHQRSALEKMKNGCILCGGVGSGKSRTALAYYYLQQGGNLDIPDAPMKNPLDIYIITTARKRDRGSSPFLYRTVDRTALAEEKPTGHSLVHFGPGLALEHPAALERL